MPVVKAGSKSLPLLHGYICEHQWYCSRLVVLVIGLVVILTILFLPRQTRQRYLPTSAIHVSPARQNDTCTPRAPCSSIKSRILSVLSVSDCWAQLKQGQGHFETRANRGVSRGEACGTALVGLGGARERGDMEEEERTTSESKSRGVSKNWSDGAELPSNRLPSPGQALVTAEQSGHVGTQPGYSAKGFQEEEASMGDAHIGATVGVKAGSGSGVIQEARGRVLTSFGDYMADDEHILYGARDSISHTVSDSGKWSHSPWPLTPPASAAGVSPGLRTDEGHSKSIAIPARVATGSQSMGNIGGEGSIGKDEAFNRSDDGTSPSSYPPTSPLLPPAPPSAYQAFDSAAVMFPGPARDGGIRVVPPHTHGSEGGPSSMQAAPSTNDSGASWTRHTRVYGGGVCLACAAAAAGEGGFYGDSVRPQDRR